MHKNQKHPLPSAAVIFRTPWFAPRRTLELATKITAGIFKPYRKTPEWQFELPIDWSADPFKDNNWKVSLHAFYMLQPLILQYESDGDPSHLSLALRIVLDWGRFHYEENRETRFSFYDFASGIRCTYMAWLYGALASQRHVAIVSPDELVQLTKIINDHIERVLDGRIEFRLTNHGLFQIHGFACLYHTLPNSIEKERIRQFISDRLPACLNAQFDAEFIHQEHSPGYHDLATSKLRFFMDSGLYEDYPILEQIYHGAKRNAFWLADPAGNLWAVGDSYAQKSRECGLVQHDWEASESIRMRRFDFGYVSIKSHPETPLHLSSGLFVQGAFHSSIHKHLDDLSFELFEKGERLLIDSGAYGYQASNERRYFQSTRAHNTIEINGVNFSRKSEHAYGSAIKIAEFRGDHFYIKATVHHQDLNAFHQREFFYQPGGWLILRDNVEREQPCCITQWFHLSASCKLVGQNEESVELQSSNCKVVIINTNCSSRRIRKGQHKPELQGWYSPSDRTLVENFAIGFESDKDSIETIILVDPDKIDQAKNFIKSLRGSNNNDKYVAAVEKKLSEHSAPSQVLSRCIISEDRYALLTVDTEALSGRASQDHVKRLIWGEHVLGSAGVREMCAAADEVGGKLVFFVDACGAYPQLDEVAEVVCWLDASGHEVQLHAHPEYLPEAFWREHGFMSRPRFLNQYSADKAAFTINHFGKFISDLTGKPIRAFRAGSFRWNADTIRALGEAGIPLSFNNSMNAYLAGQCTYSEPTNLPFVWSNGVVEVPSTERWFKPPFVKPWWGRAQFPVSDDWLGSPPWRVMWPYTLGCDSSFMVLLLHSWSLLCWDENGHAVYRDDKRLEDFRKLMKKLAKDYDIITTADFLDLHARGKIKTTHTVDLSLAEMKAPTGKKK